MRDYSKALQIDPDRIRFAFSPCVSIHSPVDPLLEDPIPNASERDKVIADLVTVLQRVAVENGKKEVSEADTSRLVKEGDVFVHQDRKNQTELVMKLKEKRKKPTEKKPLSEAEILNEWEDNDRSIDTIFLPRSRGPVGRSRNIDLKRVNITVNTNELLTGATLRLHDGRHYGLVGRNGVGKSTLLRRMALCRIDGFPDYLMVLHVKQEIDGDDTPVLDAVINSDKERLNLLKVRERGTRES